MITTENYEGYLMRYADGALSKDEAAEVELFLQSHPELCNELEEISDPRLKVTVPPLTMPGKEQLLHDEDIATIHKIPWLSIAASVIFFILAAGLTHYMLGTKENKAIIANNNSVLSITSTKGTATTAVEPTTPIATSQPSVVSVPLMDDRTAYVPANQQAPAIDEPKDTTSTKTKCILPDSLYINPSLREPVYLAEKPATKTTSTTPSTLIPPTAKRTTGNSITCGYVIEEAQLVEYVPTEKRTFNNPDVKTGYVIEDAQLVTTQPENLIARTILALFELFNGNSQREDTFLAYSE